MWNDNIVFNNFCSLQNKKTFHLQFHTKFLNVAFRESDVKFIPILMLSLQCYCFTSGVGTPFTAKSNTLILQLQLYNDEDTISFKQCVSTDHTALVILQMTVEEFCSVLTEKLDKLTSHECIVKHQANYLTQLKESVPLKEAIILLDFAEQYSFIVQDGIKGFYWDDSQDICQNVLRVSV